MSAEEAKPKCRNCGKCGMEVEVVSGPFKIKVDGKAHFIYGEGYYCKRCENFVPSKALDSRVMSAEDW